MLFLIVFIWGLTVPDAVTNYYQNLVFHLYCNIFCVFWLFFRCGDVGGAAVVGEDDGVFDAVVVVEGDV